MFQTHLSDLIKVGGVNATAIVVSLSGLETTIRILGLLAALIYTCLKIADWLNDRQLKKALKKGKARSNGGDLLGIWIILTVLLMGCAGPQAVTPSTLEATRSIQSASVSAVRAQASTVKVKTAIKTSKEAVTLLERSATAEQRPAVTTIKESLQVAHVELSEAETQLMAVSNSLAASDGQMRRLQAEVDTQAAKLTVAERRATAYHRLKFWLAAAAAGFAFYAAMRMVPPLGPYRWWIAGGSAAVAGGIIYGVI